MPQSFDAAPRIRASRSDDTLGRYLHEVRRHRLLHAAEETALALRYRATRDPAAARRLVEANLRLVVSVARAHAPYGASLLDLIQEGNLGLLRAVETFDPAQGARLASWATLWIRAFVFRWLMANRRIVRVATTALHRRLFFGMEGERRRAELAGKDAAEVRAQLAARFDATESDIADMQRRLGRGDASLDAPIARRDGPVLSLVETHPAEPRSRPDVQVERADARRRLSERIADFARTLEPRDRAILEARWLVDAPATLAELGARLGISRERVRQLERRVLARLRVHLEAAADERDALATFHADAA